MYMSGMYVEYKTTEDTIFKYYVPEEYSEYAFKVCYAPILNHLGFEPSQYTGDKELHVQSQSMESPPAGCVSFLNEDKVRLYKEYMNYLNN